MILTDEEQKLFFSIYYPLLFYFNGYFKVFKNITKFDDMFDLHTADYIKIRDKIFEDKKVIEYFIEDNKEVLGKSKIAILNKWIKEARKIESLFIKKNKTSKFIDLSTNEEIKIIGISDDPDIMEILNYWPLVISAVVMPFQKKIIWDGLFTVEDIIIDERIKKALRKSIEQEEI